MEFMKKLVAAIVLSLAVGGPASAQETKYTPWDDAYAYFGRGSHEMGQTAGLGMEGSVYGGLGLDLELGVAGLGAPAVLHRHAIGIGSADGTFHLFTKSARDKIVPFVAGGYTPFFGQDIKLLSGDFLKYNIQHGYNFGAGVDILPTKPFGARFDVRYYGHGGRILYASFPNLTQLSFTVFRFSIIVR